MKKPRPKVQPLPLPPGTAGGVALHGLPSRNEEIAYLDFKAANFLPAAQKLSLLILFGLSLSCYRSFKEPGGAAEVPSILFYGEELWNWSPL